MPQHINAPFRLSMFSVLSSDIENDRQALANDCTSKQGELLTGELSLEEDTFWLSTYLAPFLMHRTATSGSVFIS